MFGTALKPLPLLTQTLNFTLILSAAFTLWKTLSLLSDSPSPIVVVLSGSMEPAFQRGDLLFLWNRDGLVPRCVGCELGLWDEEGRWGGGSLWSSWEEVVQSRGVVGKSAHVESKDVKVGEIVVYEVKGKDIPIVHRVVRRYPSNIHTRKLAKVNPRDTLGQAGVKLLTKGDNNAASDEELYARGQDLLDRERDVVGSVVGFVPWVGYGTILLSEYPWLKTVMLAGMGLSVLLSRE